MADFFLILSMAGIFTAGYFIMKRVDAFLDENRRVIIQEERKLGIAAESPTLLGSVASALEYCSGCHPEMEYSVSCGKAEKLLRKLEKGRLDIVLLREDQVGLCRENLEFMKIPYRAGRITAEELDLPVKDLDESPTVYVLWNRAVPSHSRDCVVSALRKAV